MILTWLGQSLWLALPITVAGVLHMIVVKKDLFTALKLPLDGGRTLGGARLFGDNKTWRGVVFMVLAAAVLGAAQGLLLGGWAARANAGIMAFSDWGAGQGALAFASGYALVNAVLGLGYVLGELPNSFIKRRAGITPGKTEGGAFGLLFLVIDQADSVIAALLLGWLIFPWPLGFVLVGIVALTLLHLLFNAGLFATKVRKNL
ncbi:MAG: CDP-archaeol synthase [Planctomycetota bacterium]|jgi:CDP-diglyceride synthetase